MAEDFVLAVDVDGERLLPPHLVGVVAVGEQVVGDVLGAAEFGSGGVVEFASLEGVFVDGHWCMVLFGFLERPAAFLPEG